MYLAIPTIVNRGGAREIVEIELSNEEEKKLKMSADNLKEHLKKCLNK